jgi:hypothetical protein
MSHRKARLAICCAIAVLFAAASLHGWGAPSRTTFLTFSGPVALPGATLGTGTYIFELLNPSSGADVVTVTDKGRSRVYYTGPPVRFSPYRLRKLHVGCLRRSSRGIRPAKGWVTSSFIGRAR